MFDFLGTVLIPTIIVVTFRYFNAKYKPPIFGVYQVNKNKNYWFKLAVMFLYLKLKQLVSHLRHLLAVETGKSPDGTSHIHRQDLNLEQKYFLGDMPHAIDAIYFNGLSQKGDAIICGLARRPGHVVDSFLYLKVEGQQLLLSPCLPDTYQVQNVAEAGEYTIQGLEIVNYVPMRAWKIIYKGEMKLRNDPAKKVNVDMELTWSARWSPFNYDTQMSALGTAKDIAREQWSADYFRLLKRFHQTHYEQMGYITGTVSIDGKEQTFNVQCVRDHTFGPFRDWRTFHRYVYHFIFLENGDCMAIGTVCQPTVLSHLTIGYVCRHSDQSVLPVQSCDFQLYQHGEGQTLPKDYAYTFKVVNKIMRKEIANMLTKNNGPYHHFDTYFLPGGKSYSIRFEVQDEEVFYIGKDRVSKFYERWCTVEVDGVKGWACGEWQYNNLVKNLPSPQGK